FAAAIPGRGDPVMTGTAAPRSLDCQDFALDLHFHLLPLFNAVTTAHLVYASRDEIDTALSDDADQIVGSALSDAREVVGRARDYLQDASAIGSAIGSEDARPVRLGRALISHKTWQIIRDEMLPDIRLELRDGLSLQEVMTLMTDLQPDAALRVLANLGRIAEDRQTRNAAPGSTASRGERSVA
ncbi:MAG: hypothetical protein WBF53_04290, partial [Litorimonas sp.]